MSGFRVLIVLACIGWVCSIPSYAADAKHPPSSGARLLNFDNPKRVQNSYFVAFKKEEKARDAMARFPGKEHAILPNVIPSTSDSVDALSRALAESVNRRINYVVKDERISIRGFWVEMTEEQAKKLAADPRVEYIEADLTVEVTATSPRFQ